MIIKKKNKYATDVEQSKHLNGILSASSADMYWEMRSETQQPRLHFLTDQSILNSENIIAAWSLSALLNCLPNCIDKIDDDWGDELKLTKFEMRLVCFQDPYRQYKVYFGDSAGKILFSRTGPTAVDAIYYAISGLVATMNWRFK